MKGETRCDDGRLWRHDPQFDDPDLETDMGECPECEGDGCSVGEEWDKNERKMGEKHRVFTEAKSIIPPIPHPIQCSAPYNAHGFNASCIARRKERMEKRDKDPDYCDRWAKYIINGDHYCTTHAKPIALNILLEQGERTASIGEDALNSFAGENHTETITALQEELEMWRTGVIKANPNVCGGHEKQ